MARPVDPTLQGRLLDAAIAVFAHRGFAGATMAEIGRAARVTKGGVYFHFRSKEILFFAALDHWRSQLRQVLSTTASEGSGADRLRGFLVAYLEFHFDHPEAGKLLRVVATELRDRFTAELREDSRQEQRQLRARLRGLLSEGVRDGSLFTLDPVFTAFLVAGSVRGVLDQWWTCPEDAAAFCQAEGLAEAIVASLATGAPGSGEARSSHDADGEFHPALLDLPAEDAFTASLARRRTES